MKTIHLGAGGWTPLQGSPALLCGDDVEAVKAHSEETRCLLSLYENSGQFQMSSSSLRRGTHYHFCIPSLPLRSILYQAL